MKLMKLFDLHTSFSLMEIEIQHFGGQEDLETFLTKVVIMCSNFLMKWLSLV